MSQRTFPCRLLLVPVALLFVGWGVACVDESARRQADGGTEDDGAVASPSAGEAPAGMPSGADRTTTVRGEAAGSSDASGAGASSANDPGATQREPAGTRAVAEGAPDPRALLDRFFEAFDAGDVRVVVSCFDRSSASGVMMAELIEPTVDLARRSRQFVEAVREKFGDTLAAASRLPMDPGRSFAAMRDAIDRAVIDVTDDRAVVSVPGDSSEAPMQLIQRGDSWFIAPPDEGQVPGPERIDQWRRMHGILESGYEKGLAALSEADTEEEFESRFGDIRSALDLEVIQLAARLQARS